MNRLRYSSLFFLLMAMSFSSWGYELTQVLFKIEQKESHMDSVRFSFHQNMEFQDMGITNEVQGQATFQKPNKMRIRKDTPHEQVTISNGKKVWVYTPSFHQVWVGNWKDWTHGQMVPKGMVPLQNYVSDLKKNFQLSLMENVPGTRGQGVRLKATPKDAKMGYQLELEISTNTWLPQQTTFISGSAKIVTSLSQMEVNPELKKETFRFDPPSGTDIIPLN